MSGFARRSAPGPARWSLRTAYPSMIQPPAVAVEGKLALPRVAPLGGVPSFGREWTFRPASGAGRRTRCVATLTTSCVDIDAPHRACRWLPLTVEPPSVAPTADRSIVRTAGRPRDRRALHAACWSIGALGIIGALIATHEPFPRFAPEPAREHAAVMQPHAAPAAAAVRVATTEPIAPNASVVVPAHPRAAAQPVPTSSEAARPHHRRSRRSRQRTRRRIDRTSCARYLRHATRRPLRDLRPHGRSQATRRRRHRSTTRTACPIPTHRTMQPTICSR